jgi:hypothetical protein
MLKRLIRFFRYVVLGTIGACALFALAGCAASAPSETRQLTPEQDKAVSEMCQEGCAILPRDEYFEMLRRQHQMGV